MHSVETTQEAVTTPPTKKRWTLESVRTLGDGREEARPLSGEYASSRAARIDLHERVRMLKATAPGVGTIDPINIISPTGRRYPFNP